MKDNRHLYTPGVAYNNSDRLFDKNMVYLNANPLKKIEALSMGSILGAQEEIARTAKDSATLQQKLNNKQ